uniref:nuclear nucleic acid-binding protein C1D-like isoform X1 n=1 Tax=Myxine glutinosa TaxID=7769 RepID=UPI00358E384E
MAGEAGRGEVDGAYPSEIKGQMIAFEKSLKAVDEALEPLLAASQDEVQQKVSYTNIMYKTGLIGKCDVQLEPLEQAKLQMVSAFAINSLFWMYLVTQGVDPKEHPIKQELDRVRTYMNKVKVCEEKSKAAKLDPKVASRFIRHALWQPKHEGPPAAKRRK